MIIIDVILLLLFMCFYVTVPTLLKYYCGIKANEGQIIPWFKEKAG